ncbi:MAG TPA: cupin domain-containing protein [Pyrinomonadaceae bacterium]|nr:cupin domain-containing protein [Pyrinomonadaceae bacterium]
METSRLDLKFLLAPVGREEFFARHWEREPLVVSRGEPARYDALLGSSDLEFIVSGACRQKGAVELLGDPEGGGAGGVAPAESAVGVLKAFRRGATVRVYGVQHFWKPVWSLCRELEQLFGCPVKANLYCTPARSQGAQLHYDTHDVLVLQIAGRKSWRVFPPLVPLPLTHLPPLAFEEHTGLLKYQRGGPRRGRGDIREEECGDPLRDLTLEAGDLLYLPRGFVHDARTGEETSVHLTLGVHAMTWLDLVTVALGRAANADERFRRALPVGLNAGGNQEELREQLAALLEAFAGQADARAALDELTGSFVNSLQSVGEGALTSAEAPEEFDAQALLERPAGLLCRFVDGGPTVGLASADAALWMPAIFAPAFRFVAQTRALRAAELPGPMSEQSKLALARRLVQDGFLRVAEKR